VKTTRRLRTFVDEELLDVPSPEDPLAAGLLDSLAVEQLIGYIEDRFGIRFDDDDFRLEHFTSIEALASLVDSKAKALR
jgi:acyl carrier protein